MVITRETVPAATRAHIVHAAAQWLDTHWPAAQLGPWWQRIDLRRLNMADACLCVCGFLGATLAHHEGGTVVDRDVRPMILVDEEPVEPHDAGWVDLGGYELLVGVSEVDTDRGDLHVRVAKRLGVEPREVVGDGGTYWSRIVPQKLAPAFSGGVPNTLWAAEIHARENRAA